MRLETAKDDEGTGGEPIVLGVAGLISGFLCWWLQTSDKMPGFLNFNVPTGVQRVEVNMTPAIVFASILAVGIFLSGSASRLNPNPLIWLAAYVGTIALYFLVYVLLTFGYLSQLFHLTGEIFWINLLLSGLIGAAVLSVFAGTLIGQANGRIMIAMCICGAFCGLFGLPLPDKVRLLFIFPWWQFSMALLIGLWIASTEEE